jgi:hypothetical protein
MTTPCATGCRVTGRHLDQCQPPCRGCAPRDATDGTLCAWCARTLGDTLAAIPGLVAHLRDIGEPHASTPPAGDGRGHQDPAESTVLPAAWLFADEMMSTVTGWARIVDEEGPGRFFVADDVCAWLMHSLPWIVAQEWAAEMRSELMRDVTTARHRWPTADDTEPARRVDIPCPRCDLMSLVYTPPREAKAAFVVQCESPDCARVLTEDEFDRLRGVAA